MHAEQGNASVHLATGSMATVFFIAILVVSSLLLVYTHAVFLPKRDGVNYLAKESLIDPKKRPFCNAFTGCGRKRSNIPPLAEIQPQTQIHHLQSPKHRVLDDSVAGLLELNAEPGIEDLSRQILSEAKLWEAIQEANIELRKEQEAMDNQEYTQDVRNMPNSCAVPPCYIA
ncbi:putative cardioactive protein [Trypoxylus dichotomus]